jgi:hypothetical protein
MGGEGAAGDIDLRDASGKTTIHIDAAEGVIRINGASVPAADHVFETGYRLAPLSEVAAHIARAGHLPGLPSAAAMQRDGVDLVALNALLLAQIEELTLRVIDLDRRLAGVTG